MREAIARLIGSHVTARRLQCGFTQATLAEKAGITRQLVSMIERGVQGTSLPTLYALARALRCEAWDLLPTCAQVRRLHD